MPRVEEFPAAPPEEAPAFPEAPGRWHAVSGGLVGALAEAARVAPAEATRFALSRV